MTAWRPRQGPPVLPADSELRAYYRLWCGEQRVITGVEPTLTFLQWRRQWIADQPKNLAAWRAQDRPGGSS